MARADTNNTIDLLKQIKRKRGITKVIIEHDMHVVFSLAERITVLAQGTPIMVEDTPDNIKGHPKVRKPIWEERTYEDDNHSTSRLFEGQDNANACRHRAGLFLGLGPARLLRRKLHRAGRQLQRARGRDPRAAGPQRRRQDLDPAHHRAARHPAGDPWRDLARPQAAARDEVHQAAQNGIGWCRRTGASSPA
jgi:ABC-type glutathione transport system ATPase component